MTGFADVKERISVRQCDSNLVSKLAQELGVPEPVAKILVGRNITTYDESRYFFRPDVSHFHDPFFFRDMEKAVDRICLAIKNHEKIVVYGDYDVDGVTSTAVMVKVLGTLGADCDFHLPNRMVDGYGINESGIRQIAQSGATLLVTVDCGVTAIEELALAKSLGIDCVVTDHHEAKETLPDVVAIVNPKVQSDTYPERYLAGVGVALKVCQALAQKTGFGDELWMPLLDFVALGTAADIVPLIGENRIIAKLGFDRLQNSVHAGLRALINQQGLGGKHISTAQVVFQIAPCINAVGRLGDPRLGVELLLTNDNEVAEKHAGALRGANLERRALDNNVADEACAWVEANCSQQDDYSIVVGRDEWHVGVIGIVASKLVEKYHRPSILFSIGADGLARGSGRSIPGLHLLNALDKCSDVLETYGGHAAAAGMCCRRENIEIFRSKFNDAVRSMINIDDFVPQVVADAEVTLPEITPKVFRLVKEMEPFGPGNMRPVLYCKDLQHKYAPKIVGSKHVKMALTKDGITMDAIGFNLGDRFSELRSASRMGVAFSLDENEWNGKVSLQMKVKGFSV